MSKKRSQRTHDIADVRIEIDEALAGPAPESEAAEPAGWPARTSATFAIVAVVAGILLGWLGSQLFIEPEAPSAPGLTGLTRLTYDPRLSEWPTWSPAGQLAFASNRDGDFDIYVRNVGGGQDVNITADEPADDFQPAFSADGEWIAFISTRNSKTQTVKIGATIGFEFRTLGGDLWVVESLGGRPQRLAEESNFPVWHPDGRLIAYVSGRENHRAVIEVNIDDGSLRNVLPGDSSEWEIVRLRYSPDGSWISFDTANPDRVMLMPAAGGTPRELLAGLSHVWSPLGDRLYYLIRSPSGGTALRSVQIDPRTGTLQGSRETVGLTTGLLRDLAISRDGSRFAATELEGSLNLTRLPLTADGGAPAGPEEQLSAGRVIDRFPAYSPDGGRIALPSDRLGKQEVWILDIETRGFTLFELPGEYQGVNLPFWHPDGKRLAVTRTHANGDGSLWLVALDGSSAVELQPPQPGLNGSSVSHDGTQVLYTSIVDGFRQMFAHDLGSGEGRQLTTTAGDKGTGFWSPNDRWVVFDSNTSGHYQGWRVPSSGGEEERLTEGTDRIKHIFFSPDGNWLYFQPNHQNVYRMPSSGGAPQAVTDFPVSGLFLEEPTISPDGDYLLYSRSNGGSTLWVLSLTDASR